MVREKVGVALNAGNLMVDVNVERPVDRVAALAAATHLGSELWHMKYAGQVSAPRKRTVAVILARKLAPPGRRREPSEMLVKVALLALDEWIHDRCPQCLGRRFVGGERQRVETSPSRACPRCNATGRLVMMARDRALFLGIPIQHLARWEPKLQKVAELISRMDIETGISVAKRLRNA